MSIILLLFFPLLFLTLYIITQHFLHKILNLPPTPFPILPLIGHIYFLHNPKLPLHRALSKISKRHGPILFLWFGSRPVLLVSSPSTAQECLTKNDIIFANRPNILNGKHFGYNFTSLAWSSYGDHWRNLRRIASLEVLSSHKIQTLTSIRANVARIMVLKLVNNFNKNVEMKYVLFEYTYNVVMGMITGREENENRAEFFREILWEMSKVTMEANVVDFLPFMKWIWGFKNVEKKMILVQRKRDEFMQNVIDGHRRLVKDGCVKKKKKLLLEVLLDLQRDEPESFSVESIKNLMLVLVQGASHTSSTTLEWAISLLLENPDILSKAKSEIDNLVGNDRLITESDIANLPYLLCIIKETLRMHPAAPLLTPHVSSRNCKVSGFYIPSGTMLLVNAWDIQNDSETWEEPDKFRPERFEGGRDYEFGYIPFGWGRRGCPGEKLGMNMIGLGLGCLIQCFEWEKIGEIDMREGKGVITPRFQQLSARFVPHNFVFDLVS